MKNRIVAGIMASCMLFSLFTVLLQPVFAQENTINISDKEDFINFAKKCTLDTWSQGKIVNLTCDIDFNGTKFSPIPTFGGSFNGNGYAISGINLSDNGSYLGVFRYVQQSGKVSNLNVSGTFTPNGSKSYIGGIVGENSGIIENCTFNGNIKGENVIGGIVGNNTSTGQIISCISDGNITGENFTGGIAGKTDGLVLSCSNNSAINTIYEETKQNFENLDTDVGAIVENKYTSDEEYEDESVLGHSDTGGITGYSSGVVQGCTNNAPIGYKHIGYNVGGIAGRQSGYLLGCENFGFIQGRKDVGGIVGQAEPYILLHVSESGLKELRQELNTLNTMVNRFITDADTIGTDTEQHLTEISKYTSTAQDSTEKLINQGVDFIDDNIGEINAQAAILSNTLNKMTPVLEDLKNGSNDLENSLDKIVLALKDIKIYSPDLNDEIDAISSALSSISKAERNINRATTGIGIALDDLDDAVKISNPARVNMAFSNLFAAFKKILTAQQTIKSSLETIQTILETKPESFESIGIDAKQLAQNIKLAKDCVDTIISSMQTITKSLNTIILNTNIDFSKFQSAAQNMEEAMGYLDKAVRYIAQNLKDAGTAVGDAVDEIEKYSSDVIEQLNFAKGNLEDAITSLSYATEDIETAISDAKDIVSDLANEKPLEFVKLGDDFKNANTDLFNSLSDISGEIDKLKNTLSNGKTSITNNLTSISNQFNLVMNLLIGEFENLKNGTDSLSDIFVDASDEDIENTRQGKIADCHNFGTIEADRNTGGIAGAMAIEYSKDPEDDIEKPNSLNFTYKTKAVLQGCINDGEITGKKDCTGGIVGFSAIGTVYECQNYADVESKNGNYVGGIAGKSESTIRKSYAKNKLTGKRYIGGIAGKANIVTACYTIINANGDENTGAICGDVEDKANLYLNFYTDNGLGAIDGVSYKDKAEPISFEELKTISSVPRRFISFTITFVADDKVIATQDVKYGDDTARIKYPEIPTKDGCFGIWQKINAKTITENIEILCEYQPYITVLSSVEKNAKGKLSLALAEGNFTDAAQLHITEAKDITPIKKADNIKVYKLLLANTDIKAGEAVKIRLLNENKDRLTIWCFKNDKWEEIDVDTNGKYVTFSLNGTENHICVKYEERAFNFIYILIPAIFILAIFFLITIKYKKRIINNNH